MSDAYLGEIKLFAGNYAPPGWHLCDGSLLPISSYQALYSLFGVTYGGDGVTTFGIPDLRGRVPVGQGQGPGLSNYAFGTKGGSETVTLTPDQLPAHTHTWQVSTGNGTTNTPSSAVMLAKPAGTTNSYTLYRAGSESGITYTPGPADMISNAVGNMPHTNVMPSMALYYIICTESGVYPQRN